jgi:hypothetical protein
MMIDAGLADARFAKYPAAKQNVETRNMMPQKMRRRFFMR